jgi:hypothetical protein
MGQNTGKVTRRHHSSLMPLLIVGVLVGLGGAAAASTRTVWWCERDRADQMTQLETTAHDLFGSVSNDVRVLANCGGDSGEHYPDPGVSIRARGGIAPREIEAVLLDAGWEAKQPDDKGVQGRYFSPDGVYQVSVSWNRTPDVPYPFLAMELMASNGR